MAEMSGRNRWWRGYFFQQTSDGGYLVGGYSDSNSGDVTGNHGSTDFWIVKLSSVTEIVDGTAGSNFNVFPNPGTNHLTVDLGFNNKKVEVVIVDINGKIIYSTTATETQKIEVNTKYFEAGVYFLQLLSEDLIEMKKLIITK